MALRVKALLFSVFAVLPILLFGYQTGAPPRVTGAPGDSAAAPPTGTCLNCHSGPQVSGSSAIALNFPGGLTYTPGVAQRITLTVNDPGAAAYGFELTARLSTNLSDG